MQRWLQETLEGMTTDPVSQLLASHPTLKEADVRAEYDALIDAGVPIEGALNTIRKRSGLPLVSSTPRASGGAGTTIEAEILTRNTATGGMKRLYGHLRIGAETFSYSAFQDVPEQGSIIRAVGAEAGTYQGRKTFTFGRGCTITLVKGPQPAADTPIAKITGGRVNVEGRITDYKRLTRKTADASPYWRGTIADATGGIDFVSWDTDPQLTMQQEVRFENAGVDAYQGRLNLVLGNGATIQKPKAPVAKDVRTAQSITIAKARTGGELYNVEIEGLIVEITIDRSGLMLKCGAPVEGQSPCNRGLENGICREHKAREGEPDLRLKGLIDDGQESIPFFLGRAQAEKVLGTTLDEILKDPKAFLNPRKPAFEAEKLLVGRRMALAGRVRPGPYESQMFADTFRFVEVDTKPLIEAARKLLASEAA